MKAVEWKQKLSNGEFSKKVQYMYACEENEIKGYEDRYIEVIDGYEASFGEAEDIRLFSAPGRTEIGGNHTDHQHGCVLAASLNLDVIGAAALNGTNIVRIQSKGYPMDEIDLDNLEINPAECEKAASLIRGILRSFRDKGYKLQGFNAYTLSSVLKGSGMSSSAAFEVLVGNIVNSMFANDEVDAVEIAKIGQYAENVYFGKPSGLMDQMASSVGSIVGIDFKDIKNPIIEKVEFDFTKTGHALCIIDSGADHADLTCEYAGITTEMKKVANFFGKDFLRDVDPVEFNNRLAEVRAAVGDDRAILRAMHFFNDNQIAQDEKKALQEDDFEAFCDMIKKSGRSSFMYLQNVYAASMPDQQAVSLSLAMCDELLGEAGAYRVHGGGFAGTIQAFVPLDMLGEFKEKIEAVIGKGACYVLSIRPVGGCEFK